MPGAGGAGYPSDRAMKASPAGQMRSDIGTCIGLPRAYRPLELGSPFSAAVGGGPERQVLICSDGPICAPATANPDGVGFRAAYNSTLWRMPFGQGCNPRRDGQCQTGRRVMWGPCRPSMRKCPGPQIVSGFWPCSAMRGAELRIS